MLGLEDIGRHLKRDKKLIRFAVLIILFISLPPTPNRHFSRAFVLGTFLHNLD